MRLRKIGDCHLFSRFPQQLGRCVIAVAALTSATPAFASDMGGIGPIFLLLYAGCGLFFWIIVWIATASLVERMARLFYRCLAVTLVLILVGQLILSGTFSITLWQVLLSVAASIAIASLVTRFWDWKTARVENRARRPNNR